MSNVKIIYSLKIHIELGKRGFHFITEMRNPNNPQFNCWVYEATPEFLDAFNGILEGSCGK